MFHHVSLKGTICYEISRNPSPHPNGIRLYESHPAWYLCRCRRFTRCDLYNQSHRPAPGFLLPRTALPSFLHILFQLAAYALFGAAFAILWKAPLPQKTYRLRLQKKCALVLFVCVLVLCYVWIPVVCKAGSYFLGVLLCGVILLSLFVLACLSYRISLLTSVLLVVFSVWALYILYITLSFLLFC